MMGTLCKQLPSGTRFREKVHKYTADAALLSGCFCDVERRGRCGQNQNHAGMGLLLTG